MVSKKETFFAEVPTMKQAQAVSSEAMLGSKTDGTDWLLEIEQLHRENIRRQRTEIEVQYLRINNGCTGYLPTAAEYDRGGYEVLHSYLLYYKYSDKVMPLHRDTADRLVDAVVKQWRGI